LGRTQEAYEKAVTELFNALDRAEEHLQNNHGPFYWGDHITESDIRLFTTIIRFDVVYVQVIAMSNSYSKSLSCIDGSAQHFKCNIRDIRSGYPALHNWLRHLYWDVPAFHDTTEFTHIKNH